MTKEKEFNLRLKDSRDNWRIGAIVLAIILIWLYISCIVSMKSIITSNVNITNEELSTMENYRVITNEYENYKEFYFYYLNGTYANISFNITK